jgi:hypothetical protein
MYLVPSFKVLNLKKENKHLIIHLLNYQYFDEEYYFNTNQDLKNLSNLRKHYLTSGYFENRLPFDPLIDKIFYKFHYKDLTNIEDSYLVEHYKIFGFLEGRLPNISSFDFDFYIKQYEHLIDVSRYGLNREGIIKHYLDHGYKNLFLPYNIFR